MKIFEKHEKYFRFRVIFTVCMFACGLWNLLAAVADIAYLGDSGRLGSALMMVALRTIIGTLISGSVISAVLFVPYLIIRKIVE